MPVIVTWRHKEGAVPMSLQARIYDALGPIYSNPQFAQLLPKDGQPALAPAQLALVTIFQFVGGMSDRQATDAVRGRID